VVSPRVRIGQRPKAAASTRTLRFCKTFCKNKWNFVNLCWILCPRGTGIVDTLHLLTPMLADPANVRTFGTALFGCEWVYSVELSDSPSACAGT